MPMCAKVELLQAAGFPSSETSYSFGTAWLMILFTIMASAIKGIVSKNKIRYKNDGFDLDLSYIAENIIAMGFPAQALERFYRNHITDVVKFFDSKHYGSYKIYNLCAENNRRYDVSKFHGPVELRYAFHDHNPPPFELLKPFCESMHEWLNSDSKHVVGIHCKAGKGRTGVMICAYLLHAGGCKPKDGEYVTIADADSALEYYGRNRTHDAKGVTIPSQKRYVYYYEDLLKRNLEYHLVTLKLTSLSLTAIPFINGGVFTLHCEVYQIQTLHRPKQKLMSFETEVKKNDRYIQFKLDEELYLSGDVKFEFFIKKIKKEKLFHFCINTFFVQYGKEEVMITADHCQRCNGNSTMYAASKHTNPQESLNELPVIDLSFLDLIQQNSQCEDSIPSCFCDEVSSNLSIGQKIEPSVEISSVVSTDFVAIPSTDTGLNGNVVDGVNNCQTTPQPSYLLPSTSTSWNDDKPSTSYACTSSSCSIQSLGCKPSTECGSKQIYAVLPKSKLDKAYKDKSHKTFSADFKVVLGFIKVQTQENSQENSTGGDMDSIENSSSDTDSDDDSSDLDSNDRKFVVIETRTDEQGEASTYL